MDARHNRPRNHNPAKASLAAIVAGALLIATNPVLAASDIEVLTAQIAEDGSKIAWGHAVAVLDAPVDDVLPIVVDYANYVQFMPNFTKSKVLAQRGNRAMVYMEVSLASGTLTLWGQLKMAERPKTDEATVIEARMLEGNMQAFRAEWRLTPVDGGKRTEVDFKIYVDPDLPLPSSVFSRENERAAGKTIRALQTRVTEAS